MIESQIIKDLKNIKKQFGYKVCYLRVIEGAEGVTYSEICIGGENRHTFTIGETREKALKKLQNNINSLKESYFLSN